MQDIDEAPLAPTSETPRETPREYGSDPCECMFRHQSIHNGIEQPQNIAKVLEMIKAHPGYLTKISSLTRWVLDNVVTGVLFPQGADAGAEEANHAYARCAWEYLHWDGEDKLFSEGEGAEVNFIKMFGKKV